MIKAQDIVGLPVIGIKGAIELGEIKNILFDTCGGKIKYLLVMDKKWYMGAKLIFFDDILSIGGDAIIIQNEKDLKKILEIEEAMALAEKGIEIVGSKVFNEKGGYIGIIKEYYISKKDGGISKLHLEGSHGPIIKEHLQIISFGVGILVVQEPTTEEDSIPEEPNISSKNSKELFEKRQRQYLVGRRGTKRILDESGNILLEEGQVLTPDILDKVKDKSKIIELTINTK